MYTNRATIFIYSLLLAVIKSAAEPHHLICETPNQVYRASGVLGNTPPTHSDCHFALSLMPQNSKEAQTQAIATWPLWYEKKTCIIVVMDFGGMECHDLNRANVDWLGQRRAAQLAVESCFGGGGGKNVTGTVSTFANLNPMTYGPYFRNVRIVVTHREWWERYYMKISESLPGLRGAVKFVFSICFLDGTED
jgi:hypothetical protein